jgi:hypothetical protein
MNPLNRLTFSQLSAASQVHAVRMWQKYNNKSNRTEDQIKQLFKEKKWLFNRKGEQITAPKNNPPVS